jgi:hypothetical protein
MQVAGMWIYPRARMKKMADGIEWIMTRAPGGAYTPDWMVQAAIDRIRAKNKKYEHTNLRTQHDLAEFDLE